MSCFPCFGSKELESIDQEDFSVAQTKGHPSSQSPVTAPANQTNTQKQEGAAAADTNEANEVENNSLHNFGFRELAMATKNFRRECLLGESRVGKVYKGTLQGSGQVVAVKQLDRHGTKANKEFLAQVMKLSLLRHPNLAELIGYCADGDQRILVYEYMEKGSLNNHLHEFPPERDALDWITRMKIASGSAQALEYLHEKVNPPILCRNFKSTNIMLDESYEPKLTDYGLVRLEIDSGNTMHQRMVCTVGCAPEYEQNAEFTPKFDVYSFGVVLLELITGRKALDTTLPVDDQNLVIWAQPYFKEPKRFPEMADPQLKGTFPDKSLNQAVGVAAMCVQDDPSVRPMISDVVVALSFLTLAPPPPQTEPGTSTNGSNEETRLSSSSEDPEQELEEALSQNDATEDLSYSDSDDEDDESPIRIKNNKTTGYGEDRGGTSSSESLYNEDDYDDDEEQQEETNYRSKSKPKSIKRKVTFEKEKKSVSRNSSKGNNKSFQTYSGSSLKKKSAKRISSRNNSKRADGSLSKKSHDVTKDDQNSSKPYTSKNDSASRSNKSFKTNLNSSSNNDWKSSKNNERVDVSLSKKSHPDDDQSSREP